MARQTLGVFLGSKSAWNRGNSSPMSRCAYHTSSMDMPDSSLMVTRYERTARRTILDRSFFVKPFSRPAISRLTANRFTSHSHGPGAVSSKSFTSKNR